MIDSQRGELAIIISYPTSASGIIVLSKKKHQYSLKSGHVLFCKILSWTAIVSLHGKKFQNFSCCADIHMYTYHICRACTWYNGSYTMATKPIKFLELHYTMTQFVIKLHRQEGTLLLNKLLQGSILQFFKAVASQQRPTM